MVIADLTVAQPTFLGKVGEVEDAVKQLEEEKMLVKKDSGVSTTLAITTTTFDINDNEGEEPGR